MTGTGPPLAPASQRRVRALVHLLRTPLSAALLHLRLSALTAHAPGALAEIEAALMELDGALARLLPLAAGLIPTLARTPGDLVPLVVPPARAAGAALQAPSTLMGSWDRFAVVCIVRNLLSLAPGGGVALILTREARGATLALSGSGALPAAADPRLWLIRRLAEAHSGRASFSSAPGRVSARLFLAGSDDWQD